MHRVLNPSYVCLALMALSTIVLPEAMGGEDSTWKVLDGRVGQLQREGKMGEALKTAGEALKAAVREFGENHRNTGIACDRLAGLHSEKGDYVGAEKLLRRALTIFETVQGKDHADCGNASAHLANVYMRHGRFDKAEVLLLNAQKIFGKALGPENVRTVLILATLGRLYTSTAKYKQAEGCFKQALPPLEKALGADHPNVAATVENLAELYRIQARFEEAEPLYKRSLASFQKTFGKQHPSAAESHRNFASLYLDWGRPKEAEPHALDALNIYKRALGEKHFYVGMALKLLGRVAGEQGRFLDAERHYLDGLKILRSVLGPKHYRLSDLLNNLGAIQVDLGKYLDAELNLKQRLAILEERKGPDHPSLIVALGNLGKIHDYQGKHAESVPLYQRALKIARKAGRMKHPETASTLRHLAVVERQAGQYEAAEARLKEVLDILEKTHGPESANVATAVVALATIRLERGILGDAEQLLERAAALRKKTLGLKHPVYGHTLTLQADVKYAIQDYAAAIRFAEAALRIFEETLDRDNPSFIGAYLALGKAHQQQGGTRKALLAFREALRILGVVRSTVFSSASEAQKLTWCRRKSWVMDAFSSLAFATRKEIPQSARWMLETDISHGGAVLEAAASEQRAVHATGDAGLKERALQTAAARRALAAERLKGPGGRKKADYDRLLAELESRLKKHEQELSIQSAPFAREQARRRAGLHDVRSKIPTDAVLVTYVLFREFDWTKGKPGKGRFVAVTQGRKDEACMFDLGPASAIDQAVQSLRKEVEQPGKRGASLTERKMEVLFNEKGRQLSDRIIKPLWGVLKSSPRWIVKTDGMLSTVPLGVLPQPDSDRVLLEGHEISYVNSTRDVAVFEKPEGRLRDAVIFADPAFDHSLLSSMKPKSAGNRTVRSVVKPERSWARLPGTRQEALSLKELLAGKGVKTVVRMGAKATKRSLLDQEAPTLLHLATHGFYLPDQLETDEITSATRGLAGVAPSVWNDPTKLPMRISRLENPLLRSGLVFAGANDRGGLSEGVATAFELMGLNLWKTDLVVLSACESGLGGFRSGEGVMGLRRSFFHSGAKTLITSLWRVPDLETRDLMLSFYRRKLGGMRTGQAFREAVLEVRASRMRKYGAAHPFYWGAFILVGNPE